ncbi:hypothetical protein ABW19_dt0208125 [Dactylella cylindrospora]|nr:hypothetical protein ABW19_dt0208125 [Dactylella cylindrospora]
MRFSNKKIWRGSARARLSNSAAAVGCCRASQCSGGSLKVVDVDGVQRFFTDLYVVFDDVMMVDDRLIFLFYFFLDSPLVSHECFLLLPSLARRLESCRACFLLVAPVYYQSIRFDSETGDDAGCS